MYLRTAENAFATEAEARSDAQARLTDDVAMACTPADPATQRLTAARPERVTYDCRQSSRGWACSADYVAACDAEEQRLVRRCPE